MSFPYVLSSPGQSLIWVTLIFCSRPLVDDVESEQEGEEELEEEEASSLETKSDIESDESSDDISTKKQKMEKALREQDKYRAPRSYSTDQLHNSPPPAYATFASNRGKGKPRITGGYLLLFFLKL